MGVKRWRIKAMDRGEWRKIRGGQSSSRTVEPRRRIKIGIIMKQKRL
jgi:hypothetical protein